MTDYRVGAWDPDKRIKDQNLDGVSGEVIYLGVGLTLVSAPNAEYLAAACTAYNACLAEFCGAHPTRLKGTAMIPSRGAMKRAITEAERAAKLGLASVMLPAWNDDLPYNLSDWNPLRAALQDMNLITSLHIGGREPFGKAHGSGAGGIIISLLRDER